MATLLGGAIRDIIGTATAVVQESVTLSRPSTRTIDTTTNKMSTGTATDYTCKGVRETDGAFYVRNGITRQGDVDFILFQKSSLWSPSRVTPLPGDKLTGQSVSGTVVAVYADPADATWRCDCRSRSV